MDLSQQAAQPQIYQQRPGLWNTNSYLSSGIPWLTGSNVASGSFGTNNGQQQFDFPHVSRSITVINTQSGSVPLRVHFNSVTDGNVIGGHHYTTLYGFKDSVTFNVKSRRIFISGVSPVDVSFEIVAELTGIDSKEMIQLTGSGLTN